MAFFDKFPYTNFQELNLDWIIKRIKNIESAEAHTEALKNEALEAKNTAVNASNTAVSASNEATLSADQAAASASGIEAARRQIYVNTERIDNILVQGTPTEGNAELIDIRVGEDGHTYPTAGDAVRGQIEGVYNAISTVRNAFVNDGSTFNMLPSLTYGGYIDRNGAIVQYENYSYSDFIEVDPDKTYSFIARSNSNVFEYALLYAAVYDENKQVIEYIDNAAIQSRRFTGAKYVRLSLYSTNYNHFLFGQSSMVNPYIGTKDQEPPYKTGPGPQIDLSTTSTLVTSWHRNTNLFTGNAVKAINRIGNIGGAPENSIAGFINAINAGFTTILADLLWTSDGVPVCCHDNDISRVARNNDGSTIGTTVKISETTYAALYDNYDFGIAYGQQYKGTHILRFTDLLKFVKWMDVELYVEFKNFDSAQYSIPDTVKLAYAYGIEKNIAWYGGRSVATIIHTAYPDARLGIHIESGAVQDSDIDFALSVRNENEVFLFGWNTSTFTDDQKTRLINERLPFQCGTLDTESDIRQYITDNPYCSGIESNSVVAYKALLKNYIFF